MGVATIGIKVLVVYREVATIPEFEKQMTKLGSIKKFVEKFKNNKEYLSSCREREQPTIYKFEGVQADVAIE